MFDWFVRHPMLSLACAIVAVLAFAIARLTFLRAATRFELLVALVACAVWVAILVVVARYMPIADSGVAVFVALIGSTLLFPWLFLVWTIARAAFRPAHPGDDAP